MTVEILKNMVSLDYGMRDYTVFETEETHEVLGFHSRVFEGSCHLGEPSSYKSP
jgi:hypothetical protein